MGLLQVSDLCGCRNGLRHSSTCDAAAGSGPVPRRIVASLRAGVGSGAGTGIRRSGSTDALWAGHGQRMLLCYALEHRGPWYVLAFSGICLLTSLYGFLQGAWPFGIVEAVWALVAFSRWRRARSPS